MMKHRLPPTLFVCFVVFFPLLPGCLGVQPSLPEKHTFVLDVSRQGGSVLPHSEAVLRIRTFGISPQYEGKGFVYRTGDLSYQSDFYNEFLTSPGSLIAEQVRQWLADSGIFGQVVDFSGQVAPTHILEGKVIDLYGDYSRGTQPRAALEIEFFLIDDVAARSKIILQKRYRKELPLKGTSPEALVQGWNEALGNILAGFEGDLRAIVLQTN